LTPYHSNVKYLPLGLLSENRVTFRGEAASTPGETKMLPEHPGAGLLSGTRRVTFKGYFGVTLGLL